MNLLRKIGLAHRRLTNFRGVDMIIPRILELKQHNRQKLEEGAVKMQDIVKTAASRIMI